MTTGSQDADGSDKDDVGQPVSAHRWRQRGRAANATRGQRRWWRSGKTSASHSLFRRLHQHQPVPALSASAHLPTVCTIPIYQHQHSRRQHQRHLSPSRPYHPQLPAPALALAQHQQYIHDPCTRPSRPHGIAHFDVKYVVSHSRHPHMTIWPASVIPTPALALDAALQISIIPAISDTGTSQSWCPVIACQHRRAPQLVQCNPFSSLSR